ncbi:MAG: nucleoside triphosphate pyrophosphohydrolase [Clostridia bacterium]|nr:nucleoside triphosphate pyrophosphohydrolase [Clostridia bacterium]
MKEITVVSIGPGDREYLTLGAIETMKNAPRLILRTGRMDAAQYLQEQGIPFETLDSLYDAAEDFDELTQASVRALQKAAARKAVVYGVFDAERDETVAALRAAGAPLHVVPGVSVAAPLLALSPHADARVCAAASLPEALGDAPLLLTELDSSLLAGEVKLRLLGAFGMEQPVLFFPPAQRGKAREMKEIPLEELDRQKRYDHTCAALIVPRVLTEKERFTFNDLVRIMRVLRAPGGCPWDREQDHHTLRPYLIEEAYETAAAIDEEDWSHVAEELGDVLLQVVFQADIGAQYGTLELSDITTGICRKMIERHPHVFEGLKVRDAGDVSANWEEIKRRQRHLRTTGEIMDDVCRTLPPLMRAQKVQKKAAAAGLDAGRTDAAETVERLAEAAVEAAEGGRAAEELIGDLLFACAGLARRCGVDAETALVDATERFTARFKRMEEAINLSEKSIKDLTSEELAVYWESSKRR